MDLTKGVYVQVSHGEDAGSIRHATGGAVHYAEAETQPDIDADVIKVSNKGGEFVYWGLSATQLRDE